MTKVLCEFLRKNIRTSATITAADVYSVGGYRQYIMQLEELCRRNSSKVTKIVLATCGIHNN